MEASIAAQLSTAESKQLEADKSTVRKGMATFVEVGKALMRIRDAKLYRETHKLFEKFCEDEFQLTKQHAYRLIESAEVTEKVTHGLLSSSSTPPANERQARVLSSVPAEQQPEVWEQVVASAPINASGNPIITAKHVQSVVDEFLEEEEPTDTEETWEPGSSALKPREDHSDADKESDALFHLKQWWKKAGKKDRTAFLKWTKE